VNPGDTPIAPTGRGSSALKKLDAPAEVILVDPVTLPVARWLARIGIHPLVITLLAFLCRVAAGLLFVVNHLDLGAAFSIIGFYLDGIDGKVARLRHTDEQLHGAVDFMMDQSAFAVMAICSVIWSINYYHYHNAVLVTGWIALYMVLMSFSSTFFRILSQEGIPFEDGTQRRVFTEGINKHNGSWLITVLKIVERVFIAARSKLERIRMVPYFGTIESEILVFMVAPFFGFNSAVVVVAIIFLLPDVLMMSGLSLLRLTATR